MKRYAKSFTLTEQSDYERSNALTEIPAKRFSNGLKRAIITAKRTTAEYREKLANDVAREFCKVLNLPLVGVKVEESKQWHRTMGRGGRLKSKTLGKYTHIGSVGMGITIRNLTAVRGDRVSNKVFFSTLCHELCHHLDCAGLGIESTPHTSGFYKRIGDIESKFGEVKVEG